jgi:hypothetical protein
MTVTTAPRRRSALVQRLQAIIDTAVYGALVADGADPEEMSLRDEISVNLGDAFRRVEQAPDDATAFAIYMNAFAGLVRDAGDRDDTWAAITYAAPDDAERRIVADLTGLTTSGSAL